MYSPVNLYMKGNKYKASTCIFWGNRDIVVDGGGKLSFDSWFL